ncbi:hypothetical protein Pyn_04655 [Prunus yedoensis var. nudiflora]|uniref:Uncharacterized protein n=1 Tax=Prunus yedoensis var. nudiflora TaxID=2094558 RepID=A0A314XTE9_PRUYE|nr:hypothetical protein Pyn_04655 [Prunus yedoensis var. nudiflora]
MRATENNIFIFLQCLVKIDDYSQERDGFLVVVRLRRCPRICRRLLPSIVAEYNNRGDSECDGWWQ